MVGITRSGLKIHDGRTVKPQPKVVDEGLQTEEHKRWRNIVLRRAGYQCQYVDGFGDRCERRAPKHKLYADHIRERSDGGAPYDPENGQCLCASHHTKKTAKARANRLSEGYE